MAFLKAVSQDELWEGEMKGIVLDGKKVVLLHVENNFYAYEDRCAHQAVLLSKGLLEGRVLTCYAHEWQFDVCTGKGINPLGVKIRNLPVKIVNQEVWVNISNDSSEK